MGKNNEDLQNIADKLKSGNDQSIASAAMGEKEYAELKELSSELGISTSHLSRSLIRLGMSHVKGVKEVARVELMLKLIKLGEMLPYLEDNECSKGK